jgi:hypothetical protein
MTLNFDDEKEMGESFLSLLEVVINLREKTKDWHEHYGAHRAIERKRWEDKTDKLLSDLKKRKVIQQ